VGEKFAFDGTYYSVSDSPALPKPAQARIPVIVGGLGPSRTPALAARFANEYNIPFPDSPPVAAAQYERVRSACHASGRDPDDIVLSVALVLCCGRNETDVKRRAAVIGRDVDELRQHGLAGTPEEVADRLGEFADVGARRVYLQVLDLADLDQLELVASDVVQRFP
jgi:alkanesulfonate monooxygenase SsuD/methylene tetrahydromethanopterin reductase-like flavin-dependent oxidoreductase (luciferase family)